MDEKTALSKMYSPQDKRPGKKWGGVMQIIVTSSCNLSCFNCTQGSNLQRLHWVMSPEQFDDACISLKDYFGTIGVFVLPVLIDLNTTIKTIPQLHLHKTIRPRLGSDGLSSMVVNLPYFLSDSNFMGAGIELPFFILRRIHFRKTFLFVHNFSNKSRGMLLSLIKFLIQTEDSIRACLLLGVFQSLP